MFKRLLSIFLAICLVVGMIPATAGATENSDVSADSGDVNFGSTNSVGHLLSENLQQEQEKAEEEATGGYNVLDLTIEGNTAKVEYASLEEATLVVALYTENGMQMLCSGKTTVDPEATEALVTIEGEVPEYFLAAAYLLDTYDRSPLCGAYKTPLYTKEMQDLLASTADDYDEELVLNLDEDASTNFLVYEETTKIVESAGVTNNVVRCDDENGIYVIENADEQFTGLQVGDIVAYSYGEDGLLIAKVGEITIDGTTVTIIGDDSLTLEEVFSHVKIEDTATTEDVTVHENTGDDFVDFEGMSGGATYNARNARFTAPDSDFLKSGLKFTIKEKEFEGPGFDTKVTFSAEILVGLNPNIDFLATPTQQYIKFTADFSFGIDFSVTGEVNIPCVMLDCFSIPLAGGSVILDLNPMVMFGFSGEISFSFNYTCTIGFVWRRGDGIHKLDKQPKSDTKLDLEGRVYICFDPNPFLSIGGKIGGVRFNAPIGIELIGKRSGTGDNVADVIHACKLEDCISLELNGYMSLTGSIEFFKKFKFSIDFMELKAPLGKWYISKNGSGKGDCPNVLYRVTITTRDMNGERIGDISVKDVLTNEELAVTSSSGVAVKYLPRGYRGFLAEIEGQKVATSYNVKEACSILLTSSREYLEKIEAQKKWMIHPDQITDHTKFAYGTFSSGAQWIIYASGQMVVKGEGAMDNYDSVDKAPWYIYREMVTSVEIQPGVTSVSSNAFSGFPNLEKVIISNTVTSIGDNAFKNCIALTQVKLPVDYEFGYDPGYNYNGRSKFAGCTNVTTIHYTYGQTGEMLHRAYDSTDYDDDYTFSLEYISREKLETVYFDPGITQIGSYAFYDSSLSEAYFYGDAPTFGTNVFTSVTATAYYPAGNETWTDDVKQNYGGTLTWVPFEPEQVVSEETLPEESVTAYGVAASASSSADQSVKQELEFNIDETRPTLEANFGGIYESEIYEDYVLKRATFTDLVPGEQYVLLAMIDLDVEDPLSPENLLFVDQMAADENGTLVFEYVQRVTTNLSYVVACGASNKNLQDAVITFPEMQSDGNVQVVEPTVVYEGETLLEGIDYVIVGTASYTEAGTYTCTIRGIQNYTGFVTCEYTVAGGMVLGDLDLNGLVNSDDLTLLARHVGGIELVDGQALLNADVNGDGKVNSDDLTKHARYVGGIITDWDQD